MHISGYESGINLECLRETTGHTSGLLQLREIDTNRRVFSAKGDEKYMQKCCLKGCRELTTEI